MPENGQLSFLADLDRFSDTMRPNLCASWKNAVLNDFGVFIDNRIDIDVYKSKSKCYPRITIFCAMEYPKVYYSFDAIGKNAGGGGLPGRGSRNFDVHEHPANVALMMEHELRASVKSYEIPEKMIRECVEKFKAAITSDVTEYTTTCETCKREIPTSEIVEHEGKKLCLDCWEKTAFADEDADEDDEGNQKQDKFKELRDENGWYVCPCCGEKVANPVDSGFCAECDYKKKHPDAQKKYCEQCIHFFYHDLYDENNHTECCCKLHLEGKNRGEWSYLCDDFVKCETAEQHEIKRAGLMKYASCKQMEKCAECGKKWRWLYGDICGVCYEKKRKKSDEIARGFKAEGWKEVPEEERENATYSLGGWVDERDMPAMEPRVGTRYFLIDVRHLTWRFFFRKGA